MLPELMNGELELKKSWPQASKEARVLRVYTAMFFCVLMTAVGVSGLVTGLIFSDEEIILIGLLIPIGILLTIPEWFAFKRLCRKYGIRRLARGPIEALHKKSVEDINR